MAIFSVCLALLCVAFHAQASPTGGLAANRDLHDKHVYLMPLSVEEAKSVLSGQSVPLRQSRSFTADDEHLDVLPVAMYAPGEGRVHGLLLARNSRIEHPYEITLNEELDEPMPSISHAAFYQDPMSNAVFGVQNIDGQKVFDGSFTVDGVEYEVHPVEHEMQSRTLHGHKAHLVTRSTHKNTYAEPLEHPEMRENEDYGDDELLPERRAEDYGDDELLPERRGPRPHTPLSLNKRSTHYDVDMAIIVDFSEYSRWLQNEGSAAKAVAAIKYKFQYTYNGMDYVYKTVNHKGMTITPYIAKLHIQNTFTDNPINKMYGGSLDATKGRLVTVDAGAILEGLKDTLPTDGYSIGDKYDHVMYWIGYQMQHQGSAGTIGLAYTKATCSTWSFSIIEDTGFESFRTAAHELGHSLGSSHDETTGDCAADVHHIMSATEGLPDRSKSADGFSFSTCSLDAFKDYLGKQSCLGNGGHNGKISNKPVSTLPGQKFTPDQQCQWTNAHIIGGGHCSWKASDADDCNVGMMCDMGGRSCGKSSALRAADGTDCGSGKTCFKGTCQ